MKLNLPFQSVCKVTLSTGASAASIAPTEVVSSQPPALPAASPGSPMVRPSLSDYSQDRQPSMGFIDVEMDDKLGTEHPPATEQAAATVHPPATPEHVAATVHPPATPEHVAATEHPPAAPEHLAATEHPPAPAEHQAATEHPPAPAQHVTATEHPPAPAEHVAATEHPPATKEHQAATNDLSSIAGSRFGAKAEPLLCLPNGQEVVSPALLASNTAKPVPSSRKEELLAIEPPMCPLAKVMGLPPTPAMSPPPKPTMNPWETLSVKGHDKGVKNESEQEEAKQIPLLNDTMAETPPRHAPSLSPGAIDRRFRRVFQPKADGTFKVPQRFVEDFKKKGSSRKSLEMILASCGYEPDGLQGKSDSGGESRNMYLPVCFVKFRASREP